MKASKDLRCYGISFLLCCFAVIVSAHQYCPPPDVPAGGEYTPKKLKFNPQEEVNYSCRDGFLLVGSDTRKCNSSGMWSERTPFCDREMKLKNLRGHIILSQRSISSITDNERRTCLSRKICTGCYLQLHLDKNIVIYSIDILLNATGAIDIRAETFLDDARNDCDFRYEYIRPRQWIIMQCRRSNVAANIINIMNRGETDTTICEISIRYEYFYIIHETNLKNLHGSIFLPHHSISGIIDGNTNTCLSLGICFGCHLQLHLDEQVAVQAIRIFLKATAATSIRMEIFSNINSKECSAYYGYTDASKWIAIQCRRNTVLADTITIINKAETDMSICEIQFYVKGEYDCEHPPEMRIANGYFEVSRNKTSLICEDGYKSENGLLVCQSNSWQSTGPRCDENLCDPVVFSSNFTPNGQWIFLDPGKKLSASTTKQLRCNTGYQLIGGPDKVTCEKNGTWTTTNARCTEAKPITTIVIGAVGALVLIIILILLGIISCLIRIQRKREVIVAYKSSDGSTSAGSEYDYAIPYYESMLPDVPSTPRPVWNDGCNLPEHCEVTTIRKAMPQDIEFGTLKDSLIYGK